MKSLLKTHPPCSCHGVIGCSDYSKANSIFCLVASSSENYGYMGIVEGSILFVQPRLPYDSNSLNAFQNGDSFTLSKEKIPGIYMGRVLMVINQYE